MEYTSLGNTGLSVSRICLGCLGFGGGKEWMLDADESQAIIDRAIDLGINFFDTANVYSDGGSEETLGEAISDYDRDSLVIATKVFGEMDESNPNARGLSRKAIEQELENSLDRLGVDTIDLYQTHRWDDEAPIEETLRTFDDAVHRGSIRYVGASTTLAYQLAEARRLSEDRGLEPFVSMQNHYNLLYREEEREMLPYCRENGVGVLPWSPLAKGYLARPHEELTDTARGQQNDYTDLYPYLEGNGREINERVQEIAAEKGVTMAQIALAWLLQKDVVDAPVVGTTSVEHLEEAVEALEISLSDSDVAYLEEPYEPLRHTL
ncbi:MULTISPECIES: aldo/keto reductase [Haloarcula]|uniref:Aldo/keto reductase n=1 Tax=Haloarcula pellucida TaxID=1427151 RepID=A0A830GMW4_9EURY|nr:MULTISPECIES: aldo/keto reductase [Halomicroarcula]MBX0350016.1 aldo/keto reductase [Halomicroarcula pellucida]MDS0279766.1 aldo/keto reductase [Halomicroarcula sp. S1AR25-4]GGN95530.1 aldo/keto reductase [Halomicroarcula pellucida]